MTGIIGLVALLTILGLSLVITRLATVALVLTGLSQEAARFQARSAFTGTGFTTAESETVVDHPVRRRIIMGLMLLRSAGIVSILLSLILSFAGTEDITRLYRLLYLVGGVLLLWLLSMSKVADGLMNRPIKWALRRWTDLEIRDYAGLLHLSGDYVVREMKVKENGWLANKSLSECKLRDEGVTIVGIYRSSGRYVGAQALENLNTRLEGLIGQKEHDIAIQRQKQRVSRQELEELNNG
jgi:hypothetical protein